MIFVGAFNAMALLVSTLLFSLVAAFAADNGIRQSTTPILVAVTCLLLAFVSVIVTLIIHFTAFFKGNHFKTSFNVF